MHWKVVFKDLETGNLLYDDHEGEIRTDYNGLYEVPYWRWPDTDIYEIYVSCVDSSGIDTLSWEQSTIGENFSAIGQSGDGNVPVQATALSSILTAGLKASDGPVDADAYESQKTAFETAFGIEDMNTNPYDTTVDQADATANSSAILQVESLLSCLLYTSDAADE